jgi:hypothetical protein
MVNVPGVNLKHWWFKVTGATSYRVQISTSPTFATSIVDSTSSAFGGTVTMHTVQTPLPANTMIYWRVNATNSWGTGPWSTAWSFKTKP